MRVFWKTCIIVSLTVATFGTAHSQDTNSTDTPQVDEGEGQTNPNSGVIEPIAPYDDKLLRLSEVLGSIHYLRALCGAKENGKWRDFMSKLIGAEEPGPKRRARLVARFNRGFRAFDGTYASCTPSARFASENYVKEGILLSSQITGRYGR